LEYQNKIDVFHTM